MAASAGVKIGIKGAVMHNTGTYGSPTWVALTAAKDVTINPGWDMTDASSRASRVKLNAKTMMGLSVDIVARKDDLDTGYEKLWDAAHEDTALDLLILDGPLTTEGSRGYRAHFLVNLTNEDQGSGAVQYSTFQLMPAYSADGAPKYVEIGATSTITASDPG